MSPAAHTAWLTLLVVATSVWLGGYVAIPVVVLAARNSLDAPQRVAFFKALGRAYLPVGTAALGLALLSGAVLLRERPRDATSLTLLALAVVLVITLGVAVGQARRMTRLREALAASPADSALAAAAARGGRRAVFLRALLGVITLTLVVLGCTLGG